MKTGIRKLQISNCFMHSLDNIEIYYFFLTLVFLNPIIEI